MTLIAELTKADEQRRESAERRYDSLAHDLASGASPSVDAMREILTASGHSAGDLSAAVEGIVTAEAEQLASLTAQADQLVTQLVDIDRQNAATLSPLQKRLESAEAGLRQAQATAAAAKAAVAEASHTATERRQPVIEELGQVRREAGRLEAQQQARAQRGLEVKRKASMAYLSAESQLRFAKQSSSEAGQAVTQLRQELSGLQRRQQIAKAEFDQAMKAMAAGFGVAPGGGFGGQMVGVSAPVSMPLDGSKQYDKPISDLTLRLAEAEGWLKQATEAEQQARQRLAEIDAELAKAD